MFGFITKATHDVAIASKDAEITELAYRLVKEEERANRIAGRISSAVKEAGKVPDLEAEIRRLTAELKVFTDRRDKAKLNLRQFRGSGAVAGDGGTQVINSNDASALGVVS